MNNLVTRSVSGAVYVILLLGCVLWNKYSFLVLMLFFLAVMMYEFLKMTMGNEYKYSQWISIGVGCMFFALIWSVRSIPSFHSEFCFLALVPLFILMINSLYVKDKSNFGKFANVYTALMYLAIPFTVNVYVVMDNCGHYNGMLLVLFFVLVWASDIGAYVFGMALGQKFGKKLFPSISPKKSWVGYWGGLIVTVAVSLLLYFTHAWSVSGLFGFTWYHSVLIAVVMHVFGAYGDLFESQWKRYYDRKDSGTIIPGHGGLLDRLDSSLFAIPTGVIYLFIFKFFSV